jgi:tRNA (guanine37-N1)-methyltransferase
MYTTVSMGLKRQLKGVLPEQIREQISDHFDVIGDIAVVTLPPLPDPFRQMIAEMIISHRRNIGTVLNKVEDVTGNARTARYEIILGKTTETLHHEFGLAYRLDVTKVFFNTRMAYERKRVTDQVGPGERVYVPFAGIGPFVIPAASRGAQVTAGEQNPDAVRWHKENVRQNHVQEHCRILQGDVFDPAFLEDQRFDRIIIPTPYGMDHVLGHLLPRVAEGGMVHFYTFKTKEEVPVLIAKYEKEGLTITYHSPCGNVAPGVSRWVFDLSR